MQPSPGCSAYIGIFEIKIYSYFTVFGKYSAAGSPILKTQHNIFKLILILNLMLIIFSFKIRSIIPTRMGTERHQS